MMQTAQTTELSQSRSSAELGLIEPSLVRFVARQVTPILERSADLCQHKAIDFLRECEAGRMQLWVIGMRDQWAALDSQVIVAVVVTQIVGQPSGQSALAILQCAGSYMRSWIHLIDEIEEYARGRGCSRVQIEGRRGWGRVLRDYRESYTVFSKELTS